MITQARDHFEVGKALYEHHRFAEALVEFQQAQAARRSPKLDYNIGLCLIELHRPAEAVAALESFLRAEPASPDAGEIRRTIAQLQAPPAAPPVAEPAPELATRKVEPNAITGSVPPPSRPHARRRWLWGVVGGAAALVVSAVIVGVVVASQPSDHVAPDINLR